MNKLQPNMGRPAPSPLQKFNSARANLLLAIILTVVNIALYLLEADLMFLFSATVPYYMVIFGHSSEIPALFICTVIVAAVILVLYLLCWILSKKNRVWIRVALVMFIFDTIALLFVTFGFENTGAVMDIVFHALVLYYLIIGTSAANKLDNMPPEEPPLSGGEYILDADPVLTGEGAYKNSEETVDTNQNTEE